MKTLSMLIVSLLATSLAIAQSADQRHPQASPSGTEAVSAPISANIALAKIFVFPNPCTGSFTVQTQNWEASQKEMLVYDGMGALVQKTLLESQFQMHNISLDLPEGLYILKFKDESHEGLVQPLTISK
jgi:hypothetical protein